MIDYAKASSVRWTFEDPDAFHAAFTAHADANGVSGKAWTAMFVLRHAGEFLEWAADHMADGRALADPLVRDRIRWALGKLSELHLCLDEGETLDLTVPTPQAEH